jgi:hypothetical protein
MRTAKLTTLLGALLTSAALAAPAQASFDIVSLDGGVFGSLGEPATLAGSHPDRGEVEFHLSTMVASDGFVYTTEQLDDAIAKIPPGLVGNPQAVAQCTEAQLAVSTGGNQFTDCPPESQVGNVIVTFVGLFVPPGNPNVAPPTALYNMKTPPGSPAVFGFNIQNNIVHIYANLRTGADYGVNTTALNAPQALSIEGVKVTLWGTPADSSHDSERLNDLPLPPSSPVKPFIALPTSCAGEVETFLDVTSWEGGFDGGSFLSPGGEGCASVPFAPTLTARPTTNVADAPSGLDVDIHIPQGDGFDDPDGRVAAHLKKAVVALPEGLVVNPSGANGLGACSPAQIGLTSAPGQAPATYTPTEASCPDASRVADVEATTPLLDHPVKGSIYIATPHQNPFGSLLALYLYLEDPESGTIVKLAGEVTPDPLTGQITSTFDQNPQLPVEDIALDFKAGAHAPLRTPPTCGSYKTEATLTPWSAPDAPSVSATDAWAIAQGPGGGACATSAEQLPHAPSFDAGTVSPVSKSFSPFVLHLRREDGSQAFSALEVTLPQGMTGKLAGTALCPEGTLAAARSKSGQAEQASPSCPPDSRVGVVRAAAGAGPAPFHAPGTAYLAGPYKGAPLSLAVITPAVAGPFDLGTIVVRSALRIDPRTAQITAITDPIPQILEGIPLDVRAIDLVLDRPDFTLTGTSCDPMAVEGRLASALGRLASLSSRFQLAECTRLGFKPKLSLRLRGGTHRAAHPVLTTTLRPRPGDANIASLSVKLPRSAFLDQAHIGTVCTRVQWAADQCPARSIYGTISATTPLLDYPLSGNVYLRSSDNLLPDLVPDLRGPAHQPLRIESAGRTDSVRGALRNSFDFIPDAPISRVTLRLFGGNRGLIVNSRDLCRSPNRATVRYTAHNGLTYVDHPELRAKCGKKGKGKRGGRRSGRRPPG